MDYQRDAAPAGNRGAAGTIDYQRQADITPDSGQQQPLKRKQIRPNTKFAAILRALLERGSLNCFQAALEHHDFVLRSTISSLRGMYGFTFIKAEETVPALGGAASVHCTRYSLTAEDRELARELLGGEV